VPSAAVNGIELAYEAFGDPADAPLLLVSGLGGQMVDWDEDLCAGLVDRGFFVVRFDNRDAGRSTHLSGGPEGHLADGSDGGSGVDVLAEIARVMSGEEPDAPYRLDDLAADAWGLLDHLGIEGAHLCGMSMGGMVVQAMAIAQPERVRSLTSIMSTTGDPDVGMPSPQVVAAMSEPPPTDRDGYVAAAVRGHLAVAGVHADADRARRRAERMWDRGVDRAGVGRQLLAILVSGSRSAGLRRLRVPAVVIHGDADPVIALSGGERTAECLQGCELLILEDVGHDLAPPTWPQVIDAIVSVAARGEAAAGTTA
jgi:pimeloyl-ACP methyl ester carboxylesterase